MRSLVAFIIALCLNSLCSFSQGLNHNFLIGIFAGLDTNVVSTRAIMQFDANSVTVLPASFTMAFDGAQANISDENGNLLMYTNGCQIADASGNTMQNGDSLNPGSLVDAWCSSINGLPTQNTSVFLPFPDDSTKYILFHQTSTDTNYTVSSELFYSMVDITQNGGLGVVTQKNVIAFQASLCPSISACKHANGRDWWIVVMEPYTSIIYKLLLTPAGIVSITQQLTGFTANTNFGGAVQFSPDGNKFAYYIKYSTGSTAYHELRVLDFDRCSGMFSNPRTVSFNASIGGYCTAFSPNSKYVYFGTFRTLFQVNTDTTNIAASLDTIAVKDNYCYPYNYNCPDFWYGYLAANGKIYISPGGTAIDFHYINQPDSEGLACDFRQHALRMPCYIYRNNVYHPNYYLGPVIGSVCDTLAHVGLLEHGDEVQNFKLSPNPSNGNIKIVYLLPQNQKGIFEVYDMNGKIVFKQSLPQWSSIQNFNLIFLEDGLYHCVINS